MKFNGLRVAGWFILGIVKVVIQLSITNYKERTISIKQNKILIGWGWPKWLSKCLLLATSEKLVKLKE